MRRLLPILPVLAVAWAIVVAATPWLSSVAWGGGLPRTVAAGAYLVGGIVCHQRPERSFHAGGVRWPVCARCSGLYLSAAVAIVLVWTVRPRRTAAPFGAWRRRLVLSAVPSLVTVVLEWWSPEFAPGIVRAIAAVPLGAAVGVLLAESSSFQGRLRRCEPTRQNA
jgi:uncharacterized membrane protein